MLAGRSPPSSDMSRTRGVCRRIRSMPIGETSSRSPISSTSTGEESGRGTRWIASISGRGSVFCDPRAERILPCDGDCRRYGSCSDSCIVRTGRPRTRPVESGRHAAVAIFLRISRGCRPTACSSGSMNCQPRRTTKAVPCGFGAPEIAPSSSCSTPPDSGSRSSTHWTGTPSTCGNVYSGRGERGRRRESYRSDPMP